MEDRREIGFFTKKLVVLLAAMITLILFAWVALAYLLHLASKPFKRS